MNQQDRKLLTEAKELTQQAHDILKQLHAQEISKLDNMPESFQMAGTGEIHGENIDNLSHASKCSIDLMDKIGKALNIS